MSNCELSTGIVMSHKLVICHIFPQIYSFIVIPNEKTLDKCVKICIQNASKTQIKLSKMIENCVKMQDFILILYVFICIVLSPIVNIECQGFFC